MGAREPGIESVFVAIVVNAADFDFFEIGTRVENPFWSFVGFGLMEHWDGDTPRDLTRNVPVFEVLEVVNEDFLLVCRVELDFVVFEVFDSLGSKTLYVDKPLRF